MKKEGHIVARMLGGLGNQLFIYSYARYLQLKTKKDYGIRFETSSYKHNTFNSLDIVELPLAKRFQICDPREDREIRLVVTSETFRCLDYLSRKIFHKQIDSFSGTLRRFNMYYSRIKAHPFLNEPSGSLYVYGYFQNAAFLGEIEKELKTEAVLPVNRLTPNARAILGRIQKAENPIGVSIRCLPSYARGGFHVYGAEYYLKGIKFLKEKNNNSLIFVFSDDISTVRNTFNISENHVEFVEGCTACEQLALMSYCKDYVIANSSFSWWGAYLGNSQGKTIVAPRIWWENIDIDSFGLVTKQMVLMDDQE